MAKEGAHDYELFKEWIGSDPSRAKEVESAIREMIMIGPASGFSGLAKPFVASLDVVDPEAVRDACAEKGITVKSMSGGQGLSLNMPDGTQAPWSFAVKMGIFKIGRA